MLSSARSRPSRQSFVTVHPTLYRSDICHPRWLPMRKILVHWSEVCQQMRYERAERVDKLACLEDRLVARMHPR
jgi:hypothetical protein